MGKRYDKEKLIRQIAELAFSNPTDAVSLAFLPEGSDVSGLDLSMVSDVKVGEKGGVQVKLVDKMDLIRLLADLIVGNEPDQVKALEFYQALEQAAEQMGGKTP